MRLASIFKMFVDNRIMSNQLSNHYFGLRSRLRKLVFTRKLVFNWFSWKPVFKGPKSKLAFENHVNYREEITLVLKTSFRRKPVLDWFSRKPVFNWF